MVVCDVVRLQPLLILLISALRTNHPEVLSVEDDDIVSEEIAESDVVAAIQPELLPCLRADDLFKIFRRLIGFLL